MVASVRADRTTLTAPRRVRGKSRLPDELHAYQSLLSSHSASLSAAKTSFFQSQIRSSFPNPKKHFSISSRLLIPPAAPPPYYRLIFFNYFVKKIDDIRSSFPQPPAVTICPIVSSSSPPLTSFPSLSPNEVLGVRGIPGPFPPPNSTLFTLTLP